MIRLSAEDFVQLGEGVGRVCDALQEFEGALECIDSKGCYTSGTENVLSKGSRNALVAFGYVNEYTPPCPEHALYTGVEPRNCSRVTHDDFALSGADGTIGNGWRGAYERGIGHNFGSHAAHASSTAGPGASGSGKSTTNPECGVGSRNNGNAGALLGTVQGRNAATREEGVSYSDSTCESESGFPTGIDPHRGSGDGSGGEACEASREGSSNAMGSGSGGNASDVNDLHRTSNSPSDKPAPRAAFGARVKVLFGDGRYYWGTINSTGESLEDKTHPRGPWSVLFDDCTQERFKEHEEGFIVTDGRMLQRMTMAHQLFYMQHPNGPQLLERVKNRSVGPGYSAPRNKKLMAKFWQTEARNSSPGDGR